MLKLVDSTEGEKSLSLMVYEPLYTCPSGRRARPVRTVVAPMLKLQCKHVRGALRYRLVAGPSTRLGVVFYSEILCFKSILSCKILMTSISSLESIL